MAPQDRRGALPCSPPESFVSGRCVVFPWCLNPCPPPRVSPSLVWQQMERFKVCEKETKTKAFSKEGLAAASRREHKDSLMKMETFEWISETQNKLRDQIQTFEEELDTTSANKKSKTKSLRDKYEKIANSVVRHNWHLEKLSLLAKSLRNDRVNIEQVADIQDDVDMYVEQNQEPDFFEDEFLYDQLDLTTAADDSNSDEDGEDGDDGSMDDSGEEEDEEEEAEVVPKKKAAPAPAPAPVPAAAAAAADSSKAASAPKKDGPLASAPSPAAAPPAVAATATPAKALLSAKVAAASPAAAPVTAPALTKATTTTPAPPLPMAAAVLAAASKATPTSTASAMTSAAAVAGAPSAAMLAARKTTPGVPSPAAATSLAAVATPSSAASTSSSSSSSPAAVAPLTMAARAAASTTASAAAVPPPIVVPVAANKGGITSAAVTPVLGANTNANAKAGTTTAAAATAAVAGAAAGATPTSGVKLPMANTVAGASKAATPAAAADTIISTATATTKKAASSSATDTTATAAALAAMDLHGAARAAQAAARPMLTPAQRTQLAALEASFATMPAPHDSDRYSAKHSLPFPRVPSPLVLPLFSFASASSSAFPSLSHPAHPLTGLVCVPLSPGPCSTCHATHTAPPPTFHPPLPSPSSLTRRRGKNWNSTRCFSCFTFTKGRISPTPCFWLRANSRNRRGGTTKSTSRGFSGTRSRNSPPTSLNKGRTCTLTMNKGGASASKASLYFYTQKTAGKFVQNP